MSANAKAPREPLVHLTKRTKSAISWQKAWLIRVLAVVLGMLVCGLVAFVLLEKLREEPGRIGEFYYCFIDGAFGTSRRLWKFLKNLALLLCIALALTPAFRMRFWNTGGEGQTLMGVLGAIAVNFYWGGKLPEWLLLVLMFIASIAAGAVWGLIPALCKAKWNSNETLFTLMMNYVATQVVSYCLIVWVPNGSGTLKEMKTGNLPTVVNNYLLVILVVLVLAGVLFIYLNYSKQGYEISVVGESENTARYIGINVKKVIIRTMAISGALCGLAGYLIGAGLDHTVNTESAGGMGFTAIMVSWLAKFNPLVMILTAGIVQLLRSGAERISQTFNVSSSLPDVIVGIILFFIIGSEFFINYEVHFRGGRSAREAIK